MTQRLVFAGDSITDAGRDRSDDGSYGDGYVALIVEALAEDTEAVVLNRGIAGDRVVDLERRWQRDVLDARPDILTVYVGVNDMWRRFDSDDPTSAADYEAGYRRLLDAVDAAARLLLIEPFFLPLNDDQGAWTADLDEKRAVVARIAEDTGARLVPLQDTMSRAAAEHGVAAIAPDGVHPTPAGSRLIADAWLAAYASVTGDDTRAAEAGAR
ncbi:SGNH/GDSL hydrolase family protein [Leifsonia sp. NPDC080035]|uniref:SGNH/GDSL hydrolase family protein n=1 Tax=Leifsonia sp. NPDC080035 TaxID=3143936 RepID=A0AAU7G6M9_9MICO